MNTSQLTTALLLAVTTVHGAAPRLPTWTNPMDQGVYVRVPSGEQIVGPHRYSFPSGFWIAQTEVTVRQFRVFANATRFRSVAERAHALRTWKNPGYPHTENDPAVWLSFEDAVAYARWAGVDLPTEAEWMYAVKAGTATKFPWGDNHDNRHMWHRGNANDRPHPVATRLPNPWGLYDMIGNAWEYTWISTPEGTVCSGTWSALGASWTRCPMYRMRDGRLVDAIEYSLGSVRTECPPAGSTGGMVSWDDDRGFRCVRRIRP
jgi:formylglycine-generating enzyme required for sulfatase activity